MVWIGVLVGCLGCFVFKYAGMSLPARVLAKPLVQRMSDLLPVALLAALVAAQTIGDGQRLVVDARLAGVAVAAIAAWRRWPFLVIVFLAALTTALLRWVAPGL